MSVMLNSIPVTFLAIYGLTGPCVSQAFLDALSLDSDSEAYLRSVTSAGADGCFTKNLLCAVVEDSPMDVLLDAACLLARGIVCELLFNVSRRLFIFGPPASTAHDDAFRRYVCDINHDLNDINDDITAASANSHVPGTPIHDTMRVR